MEGITGHVEKEKRRILMGRGGCKMCKNIGEMEVTPL
jgi:hypothetical protein